MRGARVATVRGCEIVLAEGCFFLRVPEEAFSFRTTRAYRWRELGSFPSLAEAERAARGFLSGRKH